MKYFDKLAIITKQLIDKTNQGKIEWEVTDVDGVFQTPFLNATIRISYNPLKSGIIIEIYNEEGLMLEQFNDDDIGSAMTSSFDRMSDLYDAARRKALGAEQAIDSILDQLKDLD